MLLFIHTMSLLIKHAHHLTQLMSTKISENTNIQLDLKTVVAIIMVTASFVGMYYTLQADIEEAKKLPPIEVTRLEYELKEEWNEDMIIQLKDAVEVLEETQDILKEEIKICLLYTSPSPRDRQKSRMPSSA